MITGPQHQVLINASHNSHITSVTKLDNFKQSLLSGTHQAFVSQDEVLISCDKSSLMRMELLTFRQLIVSVYGFFHAPVAYFTLVSGIKP